MGAKTVDTSNQSTSTNQTSPDPEAYQAYQQTLGTAQSAASTPYQPYDAQLVAPTNATQKAALGTTAGTGSYLSDIQGNINTNTNAAIGGANTYNGIAGQAAGTGQEYAGQIGALAPGALGAATGTAGTIGSLAGTYQPYYADAAAATGAGASMLTPGNFGTNVNSYMSPYISDVVNATQNQFNNQNLQQSQGLLSQGIASGNAFGGDREGVAQGILAGQQQSAEAPVIAELYNSGFNQASNEANTAAQTSLQAGAEYGSLGTGAQNAALSAPEAQAGILNQGYSTAGNLGTSAAGVANAGFGTADNAMAGYLQGTQVANQGAALQQANAQLGLGAAAQQYGMGTQQQTTAQAADTAAYGQFQNQIAFPYEQTGWEAGVAGALGPLMGSTTTGSSSGTATVPAGNIGSTIAGGATALTGLAGLLKRGGRVEGFAPGGAPGAGSVPANFPGGDASWLIPPPLNANRALTAQPYQQPSGNANATAMATSAMNGQTQGFGDFGKAASGLTNSSLGDSISDFTQDLGSKRGGRIGGFAGGGTPGAGGGVAIDTPAAPVIAGSLGSAAVVPPTYTSTTDPSSGIVSTMMTPGSSGMNIPPPPQIGDMTNMTRGSVTQTENDYGKALGAYYAQYPGAPGDPNPNDPAPSTASGSLGSAPIPGGATAAPAPSGGVSNGNFSIAAPPIPLTTMQVAAGAKRGGSIGHFDDGGGIYGDLSGVPASLAAPTSNWPDYGPAIADSVGLPSTAPAQQMPWPNQVMQNAVTAAPDVAVAQQDVGAANGSLGGPAPGANDNSAYGSLVPLQATGTNGPLVAMPGDYSNAPGATGNIGSPGLSTIQGGGTPEALQAAALNQPGVTRYADGSTTGLSPSYIPPSNPAGGSLGAAIPSSAYLGAGGRSMYTGPVRLASTGNDPIVSGSIGSPPASSAPPAAAQPVSSASSADPNSPTPGDVRFAKMMGQESGNHQFDAKGNVVTSPKGALGVAQVMPTTGPEAAALAGLPWDPARLKTDKNYNMALGKAYFDKQLETFGSPDKAAAAYNAGPQAVQRAIAKADATGGSYLNYLPAETQDYVAKTGGTSLGAAPAAQAITSVAAPTPSGSLGSVPVSTPTETPSSPQAIAQTVATAPSTGHLLDGLGIHLSKDASLALMSAGFGMMASRSPFFGQGIGEGAQQGVKTYMQAQQLDRQNALTNAQIGHYNAATGLTNTQAKSADLDLAIERNALTKAGILPPGTPVADSAAALGKAIGANAKAVAPPQIAPTGAPSPNSPVTVPIAGQSEQPVTTPAQSAAADPRSPVALRLQAAQYMDQAQGYGASQRLSGLREASVARANALNAQAAEAETRGGYVNSQGVFTPISGYNDAQAQKAGAVAAAEQKAKAPYELQEVQDTPGGPTRYVPKSQMLGPNATTVGIGAGSPPGAGVDAAASANPAIAKQPAFYAAKQEAIAKNEDEMLSQMQARQLSKQRLQALQSIAQRFQPGAFADQKADLVAGLRSVGIPVSNSDTANPAAFQEALKNATANVFNDVKGMGGRVLVSEIQGLTKANANPELQPEAYASIIGQGLGVINYEDQHAKDYFDWKHQKDANGNQPNANTVDTSTFELPWLQSHTPGQFVDQATKAIGYKGQEIPPNPVDRSKGQVYQNAKGGRATWTGTGWAPVQ